VLRRFSISDFRCIEHAELELDPDINFVLGRNGSGKTSLLEAMYFLGHGRSFRTHLRAHLIRSGLTGFTLSGVTESDLRMGVGLSGRALTSRIGGQDAGSFADLAAALPIQSIDPGIHRLIEEGSARRRRLLDWGVFHVKHPYLDHWRRYHRALNQRNAALRSAATDRMVCAWDSELSTAAIDLDHGREAYVADLQPIFREVGADLLGGSADFSYRRGWPDAEGLASVLSRSLQTDRAAKSTRSGPHRADLVFRFEGAIARDVVSRGQQKLLATAFVLAQMELKSRQDPARKAVLLLDDPCAELDVDNLGKLLRRAQSAHAQLVISALTKDDLPPGMTGRMFHVERGVVSQVV
jgi:DNA replication and repair protein RecF